MKVKIIFKNNRLVIYNDIIKISFYKKKILMLYTKMKRIAFAYKNIDAFEYSSFETE